MKTIDRYGIQWKIGFHFANSSFDKVIKATSLFEAGKNFVLSSGNDFMIYAPSELTRFNADVFETLCCKESLQTLLGIDLLCYDNVTELRDDDLMIGYTEKLIE